jgi:hypothetical protein
MRSIWPLLVLMPPLPRRQCASEIYTAVTAQTQPGYPLCSLLGHQTYLCIPLIHGGRCIQFLRRFSMGSGIPGFSPFAHGTLGDMLPCRREPRAERVCA